jgi:hypothetical protein
MKFVGVIFRCDRSDPCLYTGKTRSLWESIDKGCTDYWFDPTDDFHAPSRWRTLVGLRVIQLPIEMESRRLAAPDW